MKIKNKQKLFQLPKPILVKEARSKSKNQICVRDGKVQSNKHLLTRPRFIPHNCMNYGGESNCYLCKNFINEINQWRDKK